MKASATSPLAEANAEAGVSNDKPAIQNSGTVDNHARSHRSHRNGSEPFRVGVVNEKAETETPKPVDRSRDSGNRAGSPAVLDSPGSDANRRRARRAESVGIPDAVRVAEPAKTAPMKAKAKTGKRAGKTTSTKEEADWLKSQFPRKLSGASGSWAVLNSGAGFTVDFRIDKRQNNGEPINFGFPRISREMFLTLKGMGKNECRKTIEDYVASHLRDAVRRADDRARLIAERLSFAS